VNDAVKCHIAYTVTFLTITDYIKNVSIQRTVYHIFVIDSVHCIQQRTACRSKRRIEMKTDRKRNHIPRRRSHARRILYRLPSDLRTVGCTIT